MPLRPRRGSAVPESARNGLGPWAAGNSVVTPAADPSAPDVSALLFELKCATSRAYELFLGRRSHVSPPLRGALQQKERRTYCPEAGRPFYLAKTATSSTVR